MILEIYCSIVLFLHLWKGYKHIIFDRAECKECFLSKGQGDVDWSEANKHRVKLIFVPYTVILFLYGKELFRFELEEANICTIFEISCSYGTTLPHRI